MTMEARQSGRIDLKDQMQPPEQNEFNNLDPYWDDSVQTNKSSISQAFHFCLSSSPNQHSTTIDFAHHFLKEKGEKNHSWRGEVSIWLVC